MNNPRFFSTVNRCYSDALSAFKPASESHLDCYVFPRTWPSTACGFEGFGGAMLTPSYTVVVIHLGSARVYHGGRLAYEIERVNKLFYKDLRDYSLVGAAAYILQYEHDLD